MDFLLFTSNKLLATNYFFFSSSCASSRLISCSTLDPGRSAGLVLPQKGSKFTRRFKEPHAYPNKLSKSLCDPTQNQWISSPFLRPTAQYFAEILTDQISFVPDNFLKRREGCSGEDSKSLYACLASLRTTESKA